MSMGYLGACCYGVPHRVQVPSKDAFEGSRFGETTGKHTKQRQSQSQVVVVIWLSEEATTRQKQLKEGFGPHITYMSRFK